MLDQNLHPYVQTFSAMRSNQALTAYDLLCWFSQNINELCFAIIGLPGRKLAQGVLGGNYAINLKEKNNKLLAVIDMAWYYDEFADASEDRPSLEALCGLLPDVKIIASSKQLRNALCGKLILDLRVWSNYAASLLSSYLYASWVNQHRDISCVKDNEKSAALILKHIYPKVELEFLRIATDLGVVSREPDTFTTWFHQYLQGLDRESMIVSDDLALVQ